MNKLPTSLYSAEAVARLDQIAIKDHGIPGYTLMRRAGHAVLAALQQHYPAARSILVLCGAGNNAGDGYVLARLAQAGGFDVRVLSMIDPAGLKGDASQAWLHWRECGETGLYQHEPVINADIIVDALLGTGLTREVDNDWKTLIGSVNRSGIPVISVDIPSGLNADTGVIAGAAVNASHTVTFIGLKKGMFTGSGKACSGEIIFDNLQLPEQAYESVRADAELLHYPSQWSLPPRRHDIHKGKNGHVLIIGGNYGMPGAVILAARAALRSGAGLVSVLTRPDHINAVAAACPESMVHGSINGEIHADLLEKADYIAIGCGLGQDAWAQRLLYLALDSTIPMVVDADALNLMASKDYLSLTEECIITPHPGEASRCLKLRKRDIQCDRYQAARLLKQKCSAHVVLKGSGTIIQQDGHAQVCAFGNPAMATAGMGDVLTGMMASLAAQQIVVAGDLARAVRAAVCLHSIAGDLAAGGDDRGVIATDVIEYIRAASRYRGE
ncbi:MAG: NAD(P)H-hydrate dehydratase [Thiotrichales bacterium]|nr:MAG: NAD(P)H-hydrate dehydratase [Thiotrichales bacterium]